MRNRKSPNQSSSLDLRKSPCTSSDLITMKGTLARPSGAGVSGGRGDGSWGKVEKLIDDKKAEISLRR